MQVVGKADRLNAINRRCVLTCQIQWSLEFWIPWWETSRFISLSQNMHQGLMFQFGQSQKGSPLIATASCGDEKDHLIAVTIFTYLHYSLFQVVEHSKISLPSKEKTGRFCQRRSQAPGPCNYLVRNTSLQRCPGSDGQPAGIKMNESSWQAKKCGCLDTPEICFFLLGVRMSRQFMK